jgi:Copper chaperone
MGTSAADVKNIQSVPAENLSQANFLCTTMDCTGCENAINNALTKIKGVKEVKSDYKTLLVYVKFDKTLTNVDSIKNTLYEIGYPPEDLK